MADNKSESENSKKRKSSKVLKAAGAMGAATFMSRLLGLAREQVFAVFFGAGNATDAFQIAFRVPNLLRDLFAEGAMSAALVPTFTGVRKNEGERRSWRVAGLVFRVLIAVVGILSIFGVVFSPELIDIYASAFREVPGKFELTVRMTRVLFGFFPLVVLAAAFMAVLNSLGVFFLPAFASALFNLTSILFGVGASLIVPKFGYQPIEGMAVGVVIGGFVQAFCQLPKLYRKGYKWRGRESGDPVWHKDPALKNMLALMVPGVVGLAATQVNLLVNSILATGAGVGAVSWLNYAFRLVQFPVGIFGVSLAAATLPLISKLWISDNKLEVRNVLGESLAQGFAIQWAAAAGLMVLAEPIVQLVFQYGRFTLEDTLSVARALQAYSIGLCFYTGVKILVPACYALGHTRVAVFSSVLSVIANLILNLLLIGPLGYWGLALGTALTAGLNFSFLVFWVRKILGESASGWVWFLIKRFSASFGVAVGMGICCGITFGFLDQALPDGVWGAGNMDLILLRLVKVGFVICEGTVCLLFLAWLFGVRETKGALVWFFSKFRRKKR